MIDSIKKEDENFKGSGYVSLAVIYAVFAFTNWLAPSVLTVIGPKFTMILGGISYVYVLYINFFCIK